MVKKDNAVVKDMDPGVDSVGSDPGSPIKLAGSTLYSKLLIHKMARSVPTS